MSWEYTQGRLAFAKGIPNSENPYDSACGNTSMAMRRVDWFTGWFDEWRWRKWGPNKDEHYEPIDLRA